MGSLARTTVVSGLGMARAPLVVPHSDLIHWKPILAPSSEVSEEEGMGRVRGWVEVGWVLRVRGGRSALLSVMIVRLVRKVIVSVEGALQELGSSLVRMQEEKRSA